MKGKGDASLVLTGQLGDVMKESTRIALSYVRGHAAELGIAEDAFDDREFHVHVPAGAIPKDGPSAGVTMTTALASLLSGRPVKHTVGMTGEVTLQGRVLPIGGLKQKVLAAHAAGLTTVILPERNRGDLDDVPADVREAMSFHPVDEHRRGPRPRPGACAEYGGCVTAAFRRYEEGGGGPGGRRLQPPPGKPLTRGLTRRIVKLFRPYRGRLLTVLLLIAVSAALGMVSPFLLRDILDVAIPENRDELLLALVGGMIGDLGRHRRARRRPDVAHQRRRPARDARPAHAGLPPPAAALAGVLHQDAHRRDPVADRERHRRRAERRHEHRGVDRLQRHHGGGERRRDGAARLAPRAVQPRAAAVLRPAGPPRRQPAAQDHDRQAGRDGRHVLARPGVAVGQRDPARQDDGPRRRAGRPLRARVGEPRRPRGPLAHGRALDDGRDPDLVRGDAGARLPVRRASPPARPRSARSSRSPRSRPGCSSRSSRCSPWASTSRPRPRCSTASSSTSTSRSTSSPARARWATCPARFASRACGSSTATSGRCATST